MTAEYTFAFSRHDAPETLLEVRPSKERVQGMPGAGWHPRSRVQDALRNAHTNIQVGLEQPGISVLRSHHRNS